MSGFAVLNRQRRERERMSHLPKPTHVEPTPWAETVARVAQKLQSDLDMGLAEEGAVQRLADYGPNVLKEPERTPAWLRFLGQFKSPVVLTLLAGTVISALLGEISDAIAIVSIVIINAIVGYLQEAKAEAAVEALKRLAAPKARVMRSGAITEIPASQIVPGDLLLFEAGDYVPADARILTANQLSTDEALLTGESLPISKTTQPVPTGAPLADRSSMIFGGTTISSGSGRAIVTATGMETAIGQIATLLEASETPATPLQTRLEEVGSKLLLLCLVVVALVAILGLIHGDRWIEVLLTAISLAVAAIPEGLPAIVTLALALAIRRMVKRNAIVRHLPAVETLGSTDVICTDKTGTLTTGKMRVRDVLVRGEAWHPVSASSQKAGQALTDLVHSAVLCSNASLSAAGLETGDPTEVALLYLARDLGFHHEDLATRTKRIAEWSFDSIRKRMGVATQTNGDLTLHVKGAPESVLPLCNLSEAEHRALTDRLAEQSALGRRLLAVASRRLPSGTDSVSSLRPEAVERELTFLGLVAIADPPRPESIDAIRRCKAAGIRVVMITGDHPATAKAIATELGITEAGKFDGVLTGVELDQMAAHDLRSKVHHTAVYARVAPEHKLKIVQAWKSLGNIVAMTGDGVNDAPALKVASIGISMGKGGTEVARQASSMILADDHFATIVAAVEEGRAIFGNIRRTIAYLLSGNLAEILIMLGAAIAGWPAPLTPIHLLWINLVTDGLPSLALAAEPVPADILASSHKPSPKNVFDRAFYREMAFIGVTIAVLSLAVYGYSMHTEDEVTARTHVFSFLVFAELFRSFACRSETKTFFQMGPFSNVFHLVAVSIPITFQMLLHHTTWFQKLFEVRMVNWTECLILLAVTLLPVSVLELRKWSRSNATGHANNERSSQ